MTRTALFVYGTLRHDQPEHAKYCRGVTGWRRARVRGHLGAIPGGYRLLVVDPASVLLYATIDPLADERARAALGDAVITRAAEAAACAGGAWIEGELLEFRDAVIAWPPLDAWENAAPGQPGYYARCVVPVAPGGGGRESPPCAAWAYVAARPPADGRAIRP